MKKLILKGAKEHNLKDLDLEIPLNSIIGISGPSGAGKSTLVFDTIYAESQRRYIETFSPYARQFLERLPRPKIRKIKNLPAAIAISQANPVKNSRSTVATLSEITYPVRILFFKNAIPFCPKCKISLRKDTPEDCFKRMLEAKKSGIKRAIIAINTSSDRLPAFREQGFQRAIYKGKTIDLSFIDGFWHELSQEKELFLVIERFSLKEIRSERVREAVETGFNLGNGKISLLIDGKNIEFFSNWTCPKCKYQPKRTSPLLFSFNSPEGACPTCSGFGRVIEIDWDLVIPNKALSLLEGAIRPLENWPEEKELLFDFCIEEGIPLDRPWKELARKQRDAIIFGSGDWYGIKEIFDWLETKRYKAHIRILLSRYRAYKRCPSCDGARFNEMARSFKLLGIHIGEFYRFNISEAISWCERLEREIKLNKASENLLFDLKTRLNTIKSAGLTYLTLERASRTLSGGELSRLCLSKGVSTRLSETLYCLDEPSSGLHPRDIEGLFKVISGLKEAKNMVLMVENDPFLKKGADTVIALGPGSGKEGGHLVKEEEEMERDFPDLSLQKEREKFKDFLIIKGARENNLKFVDCRFPVGGITCVCGVSGSGKSTLIETCLYGGLLRKKGLPAQQVGKFDEIAGENYFEKIVFIDQEPITRTPRACPGTYLKILDLIRKILSKEEAARALSLTPGFFSLNVDGGRCPECKGQGYELVEMQFLPDMMLTCPACKGKRFGEKALSIEHSGKNIYDFLNMTLREIGEFFKDDKSIQSALSPALGLGLSHLLLGQPLNTLSGGEAQRLKISKGLLTRKRGERVLFIIDEPTKGLHPREIKGLLKELERLRELGNTIIVVEHDLSVIARSDWVIELGPEGGEKGGRILYEGPPSNLLKMDTPTSYFFKKKRQEPVKTPVSSKEGNQKDKRGEFIRIRNARHHNLKSIDIDIPKGRFVVITGVSGSGKSSLAFDLIFKEAQRRYLESLPSYMKQFVKLFERFDVDEIEGLSPSVAIEQKNSRGSPMSTVATLSEVAHYMRLCFSNLSSPFCPKCKKKMERAEKDEIIKTAKVLLSKGEARIIVPRIKNRKGWHQEEIKRGFGLGAKEVRVDGRYFKKGESVPLSRYREHTIDWVFGPFKGNHKELTEEAISRFLSLGSGQFFIESNGEETPLSTKYFCKTCLISVPSPDPLLFSFHTKSGRCPECLGLGTQDNGKPCRFCNGSRLSKEALFWKIDGKNISDIFSMEINEALNFFKGLLKRENFSEKRELSRLLFEEIIFRLKTMDELGLGYLSLDRSGDSLSGGEAQRIRLSSQMASSLTGLTIVLDEPTIGLHPVDNKRLINSLKRLSALGNSVIVVEHDEDTIREGDFIIDLGPGGGKDGGKVVYLGDFNGLLKCKESKTAKAFLTPVKREKGKIFGKDTKWLKVTSISENNLKGIDIKIPLNSLTFITGVSGSGKTTLLERVLARLKGQEDIKAEEILGSEEIKTIYKIDHSPIGKTPRSCPATFVGLFSEIRHLFSRTPLARMNGLSASHFSFNTREGMCPGCKGQGVIRQKLGLLPDVLTTCETCMGKRFNEKSLGCTWKGLNISHVLSLTVNEALEYFRAIPGIRKRLEALKDLGLGYLTLGQQSPTLSGGEAQRIKIAKELSKGEGAKKLYLLDEPSVGLHFEDVKRLSNCLKRLVDMGNTVVVVEHNLSLISNAQWIIDLGPGGGRFGGKLLYQGPLEGLMKKGTKTGRALKEYLEQKDFKWQGPKNHGHVKKMCEVNLTR